MTNNLGVERIIAIGGCHVIGFPFNKTDSFVFLIGDYLKLSQDALMTIEHASIKKSHKLIQNAGKLCQDDLIIAQLGNFETIPPLNIFRQRPQKSQNSSMHSISYNNNSIRDSDHLSDISSSNIVKIMKITLSVAKKHHAKFTEMIKNWGNLIFFILRELLNVPAFRSEKAMLGFDDFIANATAGKSKIVVISTFPTRGYHHNVYRKRLNSALKLRSDKFGVKFIDCYGALVRHSKVYSDSVLTDAIHLNKTGHKVVADAIIQELQN